MKTTEKMKRFLLFSIMVCGLIPNSFAQGKKVEHVFQIGYGYFSNSKSNTTQYYEKSAGTGTGMKFSYGADFLVGEHWSVMPAVGLRCWRAIEISHGNIFKPYNNDFSCDIDFSVIGRLRFARRFAVGLGPMVSWSFWGSEYKSDAYTIYNAPEHLNERCYERWALSLLPVATIDVGEHWRFGVEGSIGLTDILAKYKGVDGSAHLYYVLATIGVHF